MSNERGHRILLVDDDPSFVRWTKEVFESEDYETVVAGSEERALEIVRGDPQNQPPVVLLDIRMTGIGGLELLRELRIIMPSHTQILMLTAHLDVGFCVDAMQGGADDYVLKTHDPEDLLARVELAFKAERIERRKLYLLNRLRIAAREAGRLLLERKPRDADRKVSRRLAVDLQSLVDADLVVVTLYDAATGTWYVQIGQDRRQRWHSVVESAVARDYGLIAPDQTPDRRLLGLCTHESGLSFPHMHPAKATPLQFAGRDYGFVHAYRSREKSDFTRNQRQLADWYVSRCAAALAHLDVSNQLSAQVRADTLGKLTHGLTHEWGHMLAVLESLVEESGLSEPDRTEIDRQVRALRTIQEALKEVRDFGDAILERERWQVVDITTALRRFHEDHEFRAERGDVAFTLDLDGLQTANRRIEVLPAWLDFVLNSLFQNALEALEGRTPSEGGARIEIECLSSNANIEIWMRDNGAGISDEDRERAFGWFKTSKKNGTGVGLPFGRTIVEAFGGTLDCPPSASGAAFVISLPSC